MDKQELKWLSNEFFTPKAKSEVGLMPDIPKEFLASAKAGEVCELVADIDEMKELYCVLAYALAQHPELLMDYLETFLNTVKRKRDKEADALHRD